MKRLGTITSAAVVAAGALAGTWLTASASGFSPQSPAQSVFFGSGPLSVPSALGSAKYGTGTSGLVTLQSPSWSPVAGSAGSVTTPGDLALVDAAGDVNGLHVSVFVTNLSALQRDYSSFALPIDVYYLASGSNTQGQAYLSTAACAVTRCSWQLANGVGASPAVSASVTYLTSDTGMVAFTLPRGYFDITLQAGGSFYCTNTSGGTLSPSFFISAKPA